MHAATCKENFSIKVRPYNLSRAWSNLRPITLCKQRMHTINDYNLIKGYATLIYITKEIHKTYLCEDTLLVSFIFYFALSIFYKLLGYK